MKKLVLVCGPAAIGKSTWSKKYIEEHPQEKVFIISADEVRYELCGGYQNFPPNHNMMIIYDEMIVRAKKLVQENEELTLIIDTTMLYDERRTYFVDNLPEYDFVSLILLKLHDYNQCLVRNKRRTEEKWVPENVILDMAKHYKDPAPECIAKMSEYKVIYVD